MTAGLSRAALQTLRAKHCAWGSSYETCQCSACALLRGLDALLTAPSSPEASAFCEAHQPPHTSCPCCEAVEVDDQRKALTARLHALTGYVQHKDECAITEWLTSFSVRKIFPPCCSCGLASLLTPAESESR